MLKLISISVICFLFFPCLSLAKVYLVKKSVFKFYVNPVKDVKVVCFDLFTLSNLFYLNIYRYNPLIKRKIVVYNSKFRNKYIFIDKVSENIVITERLEFCSLKFKLLFDENSNQFFTEVTGKFKKPTLVGLEYSICKIPAVFVKGARVKVIKRNRVYWKILPIRPNKMKSRLLINNASSIEIYSPFFVLTISDAIGNCSINVADFRNVPWDGKNFYIYTTKRPLWPISKFHFRYRFKVKPSQLDINQIRFHSINYQKKEIKILTKDVIIPHPQEINFRSGYFVINKHTILFSTKENLHLANILNEELSSIFSFSLNIKTISLHDLKKIQNVILLSTLDTLPQKLKKHFHFTELDTEGYYLLVDQNWIGIIGKDKRGIFYGIQTLLQLMKKKAKSQITVPCVYIKDWPFLKIRGMCITGPSAFKDLFILKKYIKALAKYKANTVVLYYNPNHLIDLKKRKKILEDLRKISLFAKKYFIEVIPGLSAKLNTRLFPNIVENKSVIRSFYCPSRSESYEVIFKFYQSLIDTCKPKYFLIGHDEIKNLAKCSLCRIYKPYELLAKDIIKIYNWLKEREITTLTWGDMFLNRKDWPVDITAHSNATGYPSNTHKALGLLSNDIIILDWQYKPRKGYSTLKYFKDNGFRVIGVAWFDERNNYYLAKSAYRYGALGIIGSDWGFSYTLSFGANSILCLEYGWSPKFPRIENLPYDPIKVFAKEIKPSFISVKKGFFYVNLSPFVNEKTIDEKFGDGKGWFDMGPLFDLRNLPVGKQKFAGIDFYVIPPKIGKNCIIVGKNVNQPLPEKVEIKINKKVKTLFFLHTMMSPMASVWQRPVGVYKINYANGNFVKIKLIENFNITDFRSSGYFRQNPWKFNKGFEILYGSECGWKGTSLSGEEVNLQVYKWQNPFPEKIIKTVEIKAIGRRPIKIALLGITGIR